MLIIADVSGIQDYLFQVRETGGKQARSLRFRSLYIQLIAEVVGMRLLDAAGLSDDRLIFSAAGKIAIDGEGLAPRQVDRVRAEAPSIESWMRNKTHAWLRLSMAVSDGLGKSIKDQFDAAGRALQSAKLRGWSDSAISTEGWQSATLVADAPPTPDDEARRDAELGKQVIQQHNRFVVFEKSAADVRNNGRWDVVGRSAHFTSHAPPAGNGDSSCDLNRLARHVPTDGGQVVEFVDLAERSRGAPMLGVLKADADSVGNAIKRCLDNASDVKPLRDLSGRLEHFFSSHLDQQMRDDPRWLLLYTVFSGGDDLLLVGPWDIVLEFAGHLKEQFIAQFKKDQLSISAGISIVKAKFPIHLAARQADGLLDLAKSGTKDQCAALGGLWKWADHNRIIAAGKQLADWVNTDVVQRGWLHTLLELALLRRGEVPNTDQYDPVMATARLAYHVARNWKDNAARAWVNQIVGEFDHFATTTHIDTIQLPAIIRYAMLATRSQGDHAHE